MKSNISDKDIKKLRAQLKELEDKTSKKSSNLLEEAIRSETQGLGLISSMKREREIQEQWQIATEKTTGFLSGFLEGFVGEKAGRALSQKYARASDEEVKKARDFFDKFKKSGDKQQKISAKKTERASKDFKSIKKAVLNIQKDVLSIRKAMTGKSSPDAKSSQYFFDERMAGGGRYKDRETNKIVSKDVALKNRTDSLTKAIMADEDPMIRLADTVDSIMKSLGHSTKGQKTIHERLDDLEKNIGDCGGSVLDFLGGGDGKRKRGRRGGKGGKVRGPKGRFGMGGLGAGLAMAGGAFLGYSAVNSFRDENLEQYNPDFLKSQATAARQSGDTASKEAVQTQITAQKRDVKLRAGANAAAVGGAAVMKVVANRGWELFLKFVEKRAPSLFAKIGTRLALAGGLATVPIAGWVASAVTILGSIWLAWDLYQLWTEFSALDDAEKELYDDKSMAEAEKRSVQNVTESAPAQTKVAGPSSVAVKPSQPPAQQGFFDKVMSTASGFASSVSSVASSAYGAAKSAVGLGGDTGAGAGVAADGITQQGMAVRIGNEVRKGGTVSWRTNNPGNISWGALAKKYGAIGRWIKPDGDAQQRSTGIAIFPTEEHGTNLKKALWRRPLYINKTIDQGVQQWTGTAPPGSSYAKDLAKGAGATLDTPISQLSDAQLEGMVEKQKKWEGFKAGQIIKATGDAMVAGGSAPEPSGGQFSAMPQDKPVTEAKQSKTSVSAATGGGEPSMLASAGATAPSSTSGISATAAPPASPTISPVQSAPGQQMAQTSGDIATSQMIAQTAPPAAPVVVNNSSPPQRNPAAAPKQDIPKANARPSDNTFMRALARDFAHPTAFTTVSMV